MRSNKTDNPRQYSVYGSADMPSEDVLALNEYYAIHEYIEENMTWYAEENEERYVVASHFEAYNKIMVSVYKVMWNHELCQNEWGDIGPEFTVNRVKRETIELPCPATMPLEKCGV